MSVIKITNQSELDNLKKVEKEQEAIIEAPAALTMIKNIEVYGKLRILTSVKCFWNKRFIAMPYSSVVAWENSSVVAWGNSSVVARGNSSVVARGNSSVVAWENSSVVAWGNSSVEARGNSSVEAWENSSVKIIKDWFSGLVKLFGYAVCWKPKELNLTIPCEGKSLVQEYEYQPYLERNGMEVKENKVILYKRLSYDFKTQENTKNETLWMPGTTVSHHNYNPTAQECGEGKFHACCKPYFCDEFRSNGGDVYVAIEVEIKDYNGHPNLYEWKGGSYPYKIAFGECKVLYQCNKFGKEIKKD